MLLSMTDDIEEFEYMLPEIIDAIVVLSSVSQDLYTELVLVDGEIKILLLDSGKAVLVEYRLFWYFIVVWIDSEEVDT